MSTPATLNGHPVTGMLHRKFDGYTANLRFPVDPPDELVRALISKERTAFTFVGRIRRGSLLPQTVQLYCISPRGTLTEGKVPRAFSFGDATFMAEWDRLLQMSEKYLTPRRDRPSS